MVKYIFKPTSSDKTSRIDIYLSNQKELSLTRSQIKKLIEEEFIKVNGIPEKAGYKIKGGEEIEVNIPPTKELDKVIPEEIDFEIVYEDKDIIVINKPPGLVVHPGAGNFNKTLVNGILYKCDTLSSIGGTIRPGIVHRLDKDTSGLLVVAKNDKAHLSLSQQFKAHTTFRGYTAIVFGSFKEKEGVIETLIGRHPVIRQKMAVRKDKGRKAITHFKVIKDYGEVTILELHLKTGRTHQIRVHMSYIGHPLVGESIYGNSKRLNDIKDLNLREVLKNMTRQALHAHYLKFLHPQNLQPMEFFAPIPHDMKKIIDFLDRIKREGY